MTFKTTILLFALLLCFCLAQGQTGTIKVWCIKQETLDDAKKTKKENKHHGTFTIVKPEPKLDSVIITVSRQDSAVATGITDKDGNVILPNVPPGTWDVKASKIGYDAHVITEVVISADKTTYLNFDLSPASRKSKK